MDNSIAIALALAAPFLSFLAAYLTIRSNREKVSAEANRVMVKTAMGLIDPLRAELEELRGKLRVQADTIVRLQEKVAELQHENSLLHKWSQLLFSQVVESGVMNPIPFEQVLEAAHKPRQEGQESR
jgi:hypothetical protein